ncbi:MAG: transcription termination factor NusA [Candidatus Hydrogenedentes bacterium]|nr:transcription termination factor NusA [Candidatus Hydrogenedentota bacterium]
MDQNLRLILQQIEAEKSIDRETLIEAIRSAIESAARKDAGNVSNITVDVDPDTLAFKVFEIKTVMEEVEDSTTEISLSDALALNEAAVVGNRLKIQTHPKGFGRIAAQTAKQVIIQKIKDAERDNIYDEYKEREGELITGSVKRLSHGNIIVSIGKVEALIPYREQSPRETYRPGDRIRAVLTEVEKSSKGAQVILSRTSPELVLSLFELEVPELYDETIEIMAIAREAGSRTKVAIRSNDVNVDPVGACVGMKGSRVRSVVEELSGEKIDIVRWSDNVSELCANALNPADIIQIQMDEEQGNIQVIVPQDQLSLAIGKRGQNARLASKLIGWNIDIQGEADGEEEEVDALFEDSDDVANSDAGDESTESDNTDDVAESNAGDESTESDNTDDVAESNAEDESTESDNTDEVAESNAEDESTESDDTDDVAESDTEGETAESDDTNKVTEGDEAK